RTSDRLQEHRRRLGLRERPPRPAQPGPRPRGRQGSRGIGGSLAPGLRANARLARVPEEIAMLTRRIFLKSTGLALVSFGVAPKVLLRTAHAERSPRRETLVGVFQRGACDGLNVGVPYGQEAYRRPRPPIAPPSPG